MKLVVLSTLVRAFAPWIDQLREFIFRRAAPTAALGPLVPLLYNYLGRTIRRLDNLVLRWERGLLPTRPPIIPRAAPAPGVPPPSPPEVAPKPRLPTRNNWLLDLHPPLGLYRGAVERLLEDPDTQALTQAAPQAGRILRPLCRMFGIPLPAWLRLPKRPRKPRQRPAPPASPTATPGRLSSRRIREMTPAELKAYFAPLPPHFPLAIPHLKVIRRKIAQG